MFLMRVLMNNQPVHFLLDTGSLWTVIKTCFEGENCPDYYYRAPDDISCSQNNKTNNYLGFDMNPGPYCKADFSIYGVDMSANDLEFVTSFGDVPDTTPKYFYGIMGLAPKEGEGSRILSSLLTRQVFAIDMKEKTIEFNGYDTSHDMIAHRISGSFHWSL